jgi:hypothetical protein
VAFIVAVPAASPKTKSAVQLVQQAPNVTVAVAPSMVDSTWEWLAEAAPTFSGE